MIDGVWVINPGGNTMNSGMLAGRGTPSAASSSMWCLDRSPVPTRVADHDQGASGANTRSTPSIDSLTACKLPASARFVRDYGW